MVTLIERGLIIVVSWLFHDGFFALCLIDPRTPRHLLGYFEEEEVIYTHDLAEVGTALGDGSASAFNTAVAREVGAPKGQYGSSTRRAPGEAPARTMAPPSAHGRH